MTWLSNKVVAAAIVAAALLGSVAAHAGIIITDGRDSTVADGTPPLEVTTAGRQMTSREQELFVWVSMIYASADPEGLEALEACGVACGPSDAEDADGDAQGGCSAAPGSALTAWLAGLALLRRRRRQD